MSGSNKGGSAVKLHKSLDKTKKIRDADPKPVVVGIQPLDAAAETEWSPPAFTVSARVELDEATLIANRCVCCRSDAPELEHYKVLRAKIQQIARDKSWNAVMITSPWTCQEKSLAAVNLAMTFAKAFNQTVMLVDADLRRQQVHRLLGYESGLGLADYLVDRRPLQQLIVWPSIEQMTVVSGGRSVENSAELMGSPRMRALVQELKNRYDDRMILFDSAAVLEGADALQLAALVDGIVVVVSEGETGMRDVKKAVAMLPAEKLIGYVLAQPNAATRRRP
jgi:non-specific protein-tyrosine kinase